MSQERSAITGKLTIAITALQTINDNYGKVCPEFEICTHQSCNSSSGAWLIANEALGKLADSDELGATAGVKIRRTVINRKPYVEVMIADTLLRLEPDAAMEFCSGLYEACTGEKLERVQLRAMIGDTKTSKRKN